MTLTLKTTTDAFSEYKGVDIRNDAGIVFCPPTTYKYPNGDIKKYVDLGGKFELPPAYLKTYLKENLQPLGKPNNQPFKKVEPKTANEAEPVHNVVKNEIIDKLLYLGLLDGQAFGSWDNWRNVGLCMRWITTFEHFDTFSKN